MKVFDEQYGTGYRAQQSKGLVGKLAFGALLVFAASIPNEAILILEKIGSFSRLAGGLLLALWLIALAVTGTLRKPSRAFVASCLFFMYSVASTAWSLDPELSIARNFTLAQHFVFVYLLIAIVGGSYKRLEMVWLAYIVGALLTALTAYHALLTGSEGIMWREFERYTGTGGDPNTVAVQLSVGMLLCLYVWEGAASNRVKNFVLVSAALLAGAVILTGSRGGLLAAFGVAAFPIASPGWKIRWKLAALLVLSGAVVAAFLYLPEAITGRFLLTLEQARAGYIETTNRTHWWVAGLKQFQASPIVGHGAATFRVAILEQPEVDIGKVAHNVPIQLLVDYGIIGTALFFSPLLFVLRGLKSEIRMRRRIVYLLLVWFLGALSLSYEAEKITWFVFGVAICAESIALTRRKAIVRTRQLYAGSPTH